MHDSLLLVSLGPVQEFIASARRCQDLWFGSWLLSELSRVAAGAIEASCGRDALVFPSSARIEAEDERPAVANKILAVVPAGKSATAVADEGHAAMQSALTSIATDAFSRVASGPYFSADLRDRALRQVEDLIEYAWVTVPIAGSVADGAVYAAARDAAERVLAARKNTRVWRQVALADHGGWGDAVPKSSLDGLRESVLHEALYDAMRGHPKSGFPTVDTSSAARRYFVRGDERLCGVGLLKRVGTEHDLKGASRLSARPVFHSTSHVASAPVRARIEAWQGLAAFEAYAAELGRIIGDDEGVRRLRLRAQPGVVARTEGPLRGDRWVAGAVRTAPSLGGQMLDGRMLYAGQLPALLEECSPAYADLDASARRKLVREAEHALSTFLGAIGLGGDAVPTYYATLLADGDSMGAALDALGRVGGIAAHRAVSGALDEFSRGCRAVVEDHAGSLVYAGGDDVLALLPLHTAVDCARRLHEEFDRVVGSKVRALAPRAASPTLSVGLGVGHHLDDMAAVRALAKDAERRAKAHPNKDALAIVVQLRSGGRLALVDGFGATPDERLRTWTRLLLEEALPDKAAHDLEEAMVPLLAGGDDRPQLDDVALSLATRVLDRKRGLRGAEPLSEEIRRLVDRHLHRGDTAASIHALAEELQIAKLLSDAVRVAYEAPRAPGGAS